MRQKESRGGCQTRRVGPQVETDKAYRPLSTKRRGGVLKGDGGAVARSQRDAGIHSRGDWVRAEGGKELCGGDASGVAGESGFWS
jgi:hypothetical protein